MDNRNIAILNLTDCKYLDFWAASYIFWYL